MRESLSLVRTPNTLFNLSSVLEDLGPLDLAVSYGEEALKLSREQGLTAGVLFCLKGLATTHLFTGDLGQVERYLEEAEALATTEVGHLHAGRALETRAFLRIEQGRLAEADSDARRSIELAVAGEDEMSEADGRITLGMALERQGRFAEAVAEHERSLALCRKAGLARGEVQSLVGLAADHRAMGDLAAALRYATQADERAERAQLRVRRVYALAELMEIHSAAGDVVEAERYRLEALELARATGRKEWARRLIEISAR